MTVARLLLFFALLAWSFSSTCVASCKLPKSTFDIDWDKARGPWYENFHTNDPIANHVSCGVAELSPTDFGFDMAAKRYYNGSYGPKMYLAHQIRQTNGHYKFHEDNDEVNDYDSTGTIDLAAVKEDSSSYFDKDVSCVFGPNYLLHIACYEKGGWAIWMSSLTPDPAPDDVISALNALTDLGISTNLYMSGCSGMKFA